MTPVFKYNKDKKALIEKSRVKRPDEKFYVAKSLHKAKDAPESWSRIREYESHLASLRHIDTPYEDWGEGELCENKDFVVKYQFCNFLSRSSKEGIIKWYNVSADEFNSENSNPYRRRIIALPLSKPERAGKDNQQDAWEWVAIFYGALKELVELKHIKDMEGKTDEYLDRQPKAWYLATESIKLWNDSDYGALPIIALPISTPEGEKEGESWGNWFCDYISKCIMENNNPNATLLISAAVAVKLKSLASAPKPEEKESILNARYDFSAVILKYFLNEIPSRQYDIDWRVMRQEIRVAAENILIAYDQFATAASKSKDDAAINELREKLKRARERFLKIVTWSNDHDETGECNIFALDRLLEEALSDIQSNQQHSNGK